MNSVLNTGRWGMLTLETTPANEDLANADLLVSVSLHRLYLVPSLLIPMSDGTGVPTKASCPSRRSVFFT